ncbi:MAG TPA: hypothetical protein VE442_18815 [Jatrophihabitans sp.]|jgi:FtsH-binding integral membrane protein|nr:hypothetical protein [Jatrophihabitans sp.]
MIGLRPAPLRPLGVGEILDGAVRLVWRNARAALSISVPFAVVRAGIGAWVTYAAIDSDSALTIGTAGTLLLSLMFGTLVAGLLAPMLSSDLLGTQISARESLQRVRRQVWPLIGLSLLVTLAEGAGLTACVVGGVWMWGVWAVAAPALVLERTGASQALSRSMALVRGTFWRVWGIRALGWLLTSVLSALFSLPFQALASYISNSDPLDQSPSITHPGAYVVILAIGGILSAAILQPVAAAIDLLIYTDLRMRKEGMDIVLTIPPESGPVTPGRAAAPAW